MAQTYWAKLTCASSVLTGKSTEERQTSTAHKLSKIARV